jgi:hypothetical protein
MKDRQKCRVTRPTTGCCPNKETCIEEKQRVRQTTLRYTQPRRHRSSSVCEWSLHVCERGCWQLSCMLIKVDEQKTDAFMHISLRWSIQTTVFSPKKNDSGKRMHAHARVHACAHRSSTASQGCARAHYMCECVCWYYFANPSTVSVCLSVHVRPCVLMLVYTMLRCYPCATSIWC